MNTYVLFLRGINIGGKNKIQMSVLKDGLIELAFSNVYTYINSGNVLFTTDENNRNHIISRIHQMIMYNFNLDITMALLSIDELKSAILHAPSWWDDDNKDIYHTIIFLIGDMTVDKVYRVMKEPLEGLEQAAHYQNVIYWSAVLKTYNKSRWSKIASSTVNHFVTIRTSNTVKKLIERSDQIKG